MRTWIVQLNVSCGIKNGEEPVMVPIPDIVFDTEIEARAFLNKFHRGNAIARDFRDDAGRVYMGITPSS